MKLEESYGGYKILTCRLDSFLIDVRLEETWLLAQNM